MSYHIRFQPDFAGSLSFIMHTSPAKVQFWTEVELDLSRFERVDLYKNNNHIKQLL